MSKIAEQKALKAYPIDIIPDDDTMGFTSSDRNEVIRLGYQQGYDQALKDFLEKAEIYLKTRVYYNMHPNNITTAIQEFKNYMQNE